MKIITVDHQPHDPLFTLSTETAVTIGSFDGVHVAHQAILKSVIEYASRHNFLSVVITFSPHPLHIIAPQHAPQQLTVDSEKSRIIETIGIDVLVVVQFQPDVARMTPQDFVKHVLVDFMPTRAVFVGHDHGFGKNRYGDIGLLTKLGNQHGFTVDVIKPIIQNGIRVGSTYIRDAIKKGDWLPVCEMLGRYYEISGRVVKGDQRGQKMGFPTANVAIAPEKILPPYGVYAVWVWHEARKYGGVMNLGTRPTFAGTKPQIEVHLLDFSGDLYNAELRVELVDFLRGEYQFNSSNDLAFQIKKDISQTHIILTKA